MGKQKVFLAGVFDAFLFQGNQLIATAKTLVDSSMNTEVSLEDIRGGQGAKLWGRYAHSSMLNLELNDVLFQLDYIAWNVGSSVTPTGTSLEEVSNVKVGSNLQISVTGTPASFLTFGNIGWFAPIGTEDWTMFSFDKSAKTATLPKQTKSGVQVQQGDIICVKYINDVGCDEVVVNANFIPSEITLVLKGGLFKASSGASAGIENASKVGICEVEIPRFQLNGSMELSLEMTGATQTPLSGTALACNDTLGCDTDGYYAKIKQIDFQSNWRDKVGAIVVEGGNEVAMKKSSEYPLNVYAVMPASNGSKLISSVDLTFTPNGTGLSVEGGILKTNASATSGTVKIELKQSETVYASTTVTVTVS